MKTSAIVRIVLFSLAIVVLLATLSVSLAADRLSFLLDSSGEVISGDECVLDASQVKNIEIQWVSGGITVQTGDSEGIVFSEDAGLEESDQLVWSLSGDTLQIQFCRPKIFGDTPSKHLVVTVPRDWACEELEIDSVSARIVVADIPVRELQVVNVSGRCELTNITGEEAHIVTVSGSVDYQGTAMELELETVSADCTAKLSAEVRDIRLDSVSGDFTLYLPEEPGFVAAMDSLSGSLSSEYETVSQNGATVWGNGACRIQADTVSGDLRLKKLPSVSEAS